MMLSEVPDLGSCFCGQLYKETAGLAQQLTIFFVSAFDRFLFEPAPASVCDTLLQSTATYTRTICPLRSQAWAGTWVVLVLAAATVLLLLRRHRPWALVAWVSRWAASRRGSPSSSSKPQ